MFTVSRRVINELAELTCAINFSLLFFPFVAAMEVKSKTLSWWMEEEEGGDRRGRVRGAF